MVETEWEPRDTDAFNREISPFKAVWDPALADLWVRVYIHERAQSSAMRSQAREDADRAVADARRSVPCREAS